jgi:molybdopterin/thiamine biosynthesis adenylyltransferase
MVIKMAIQYTRQFDIIDIESCRNNRIAIIGCGAIGSFTAISLAKMGFTKFVLCDFDEIENHNLPNQFFEEVDVGHFKSDRTKYHMIKFNSNCDIESFSYDITKTKVFFKKDIKIVISCVDNMETRKYIFNRCKMNKHIQLFIDTRMGGLHGQVYTVDMNSIKSIKNYEKSLFKTSEAVQLRCTEKSIIFTVLGIASIVCNQIVKALKGEKLSNFIVLDYSLPQVY